jgi:hypothetical protein
MPIESTTLKNKTISARSNLNWPKLSPLGIKPLRALLLTKIKLKSQKKTPKVSIHGVERKDNHGSTAVSFTPKLDLRSSDKIFLTFNRPSGSKFIPVYKSEVKGCNKN